MGYTDGRGEGFDASASRFLSWDFGFSEAMIDGHGHIAMTRKEEFQRTREAETMTTQNDCRTAAYRDMRRTKELRERAKRVSPYAAILALFLLCGCPRVRAQTAVTLSPVARQQFFAADGTPLANGCIFTYLSGTTTPAATYTDQTGLFLQTNPIILDAGGFSSIWLSAQAYRFILSSAGDPNCSTGSQQWVVDGIQPPPFLNGNNAWTGNQTFSGSSTFTGPVNMNSGGSLSGSFTGNPTFNGNPTFAGNPIFANAQAFAGGISTDTINGINPLTTMAVTAANGTGANPGEPIAITAGAGGATGGQGGNATIRGGAGGAAGGAGGTIQLFAGQAMSANSAGGGIQLATGSGVGTSAGGDFTFTGGTGGSTAGGGGNVTLTGGTGGAAGAGGTITLTPGAKGAGGTTGNITFAGSGRQTFNVDTTAVAPTCTATGIGGAGTCGLQTFSSDTEGRIVLTPASGVLALGTVTLTFNQNMGAHGSNCIWMVDDAGTGSWDVGSSVHGSSQASTTNLVNWFNNGTALTAASTYGIRYWCVGKN
jgi:hypothetical protein